jgi:hypothetical protein
MAFESIKCPECTATDGFTKVEPDTYYCPYHKGLFKYVDPSRVKIQLEGIFCQCGALHAPVECEQCRERLCTPNPASMEPLVYLREFGYLLREVDFTKRHLAFGRASIEAQSHRDLKRKYFGDVEHGPVLFDKDMINSRTARRGSSPRILCFSCDRAERVRVTYDAIIQGDACHHPRCGSSPSGKCKCCGSAFCADHIQRGNYQGSILMAAFINYGGSLGQAQGPQVNDLCHMCAVERIRDARLKVTEICESQLRLAREDNFSTHRPSYRVTERRWRTGGDVNQRIERSHRKLETLTSQIQGSLEAWACELDKTPKPCTKNGLFDIPDEILDLYEIASAVDIYKFVGVPAK